MYFRARYYDPQTGEFISRDPLEYVDGMSLYRGYFAPGNVDPWGFEVILGGFAGINGTGTESNNQGFEGNYVLSLLRNVQGRNAISLTYSYNSLLVFGQNAEGNQINMSDVFNETKTELGDQLNNEAEMISQNHRSEFCKCSGEKTKIRVMMFQPKTGTRPPADGCCNVDVTVVWNPSDAVTNPHGKESVEFWEDWGDVITLGARDEDLTTVPVGFENFRPVYERRDLGSLAAHSFQDTFNGEFPVRGRGELFDPKPILQGWLGDDRLDRVFVCHSQGCNILMHLLQQACKN